MLGKSTLLKQEQSCLLQRTSNVNEARVLAKIVCIQHRIQICRRSTEACPFSLQPLGQPRFWASAKLGSSLRPRSMWLGGSWLLDAACQMHAGISAPVICLSPGDDYTYHHMYFDHTFRWRTQHVVCGDHSTREVGLPLCIRLHAAQRGVASGAVPWAWSARGIHETEAGLENSSAGGMRCSWKEHAVVHSSKSLTGDKDAP